MIETIISGLTLVGIGIVFALPGIFLGWWLNNAEIAPNRWRAVLFFSIFFVVAKNIWFPNVSYGWLALIAISWSTVGIYRFDLYRAFKEKKP